MQESPTNKMAAIHRNSSQKINPESTIELITEFANISMGIAWYNNMDVFKARHYCSYVLAVIMAFLDVPVSQHSNMAKYAIDGTVNIYYFSNGEIRNRPSIYADKYFRNLTKR